MTNREHYFFFAPTWDYPPDGPIKLGNVITSVKIPHKILHCVPPLGRADIFSTEKNGAQYTNEKLRSGKFSILTKFLSVLGVGIDASAEVDRRNEEVLSFKTIETIQFVPTPSYLQKCIDNASVHRFLKRSRYRKPIYIITGIKVAIGATGSTLRDRTIGGSFAPQVNGIVLSGGSVPVELGVDTSVRRCDNGTFQWKHSSDFVFAFRVSRVFVGKVDEQVVHEEDYRRGAMLGYGERQPRSPGPELSVLKVEGPDAAAEGFDTEELMEDDDAVVCAIFKKTDA